VTANVNATATTIGGASRATAGTAASRAKMNVTGDSKVDATAGKRKREALGEVTGFVTNNKPAAAGGKGKEKEDIKKEKFDGVVIKSKTITVRQPLRTVASTRQTTKATTAVATKTAQADVTEVTEVIKVSDDNAMVIDPPAPTLPSITVRRSILARENTAAAIRRSDAHRRASAHSIAAAQRQAAEDADADRVFKKRRTSSEAPEDSGAIEEARLRAEEEEAAARIEAELAAYDEEPEADPEGSQWDDLDADDNDDPLMVSEYVVEIFQYLKQIEVIISLASLACNQCSPF
jgi:hypothetical protein